MIIVISILIFWIICGYFQYGYYFAYFQKEYPRLAKKDYEQDKRIALETSFFGPIGLLISFYGGYTKHGRKYH